MLYIYIYTYIVESDIKGKITGFCLWDIPLNQQLDLIGKERVHNFHRKRSQSSALSLNVESTQDKKSTRGGYNINNVMGILLVYYWYIGGRSNKLNIKGGQWNNGTSTIMRWCDYFDWDIMGETLKHNRDRLNMR